MLCNYKLNPNITLETLAMVRIAEMWKSCDIRKPLENFINRSKRLMTVRSVNPVATFQLWDKVMTAEVVENVSQLFSPQLIRLTLQGTIISTSDKNYISYNVKYPHCKDCKLLVAETNYIFCFYACMANIFFVSRRKNENRAGLKIIFRLYIYIKPKLVKNRTHATNKIRVCNVKKNRTINDNNNNDRIITTLYY